MNTHKTYFIGPSQYKTVKPRYARLRTMILLAFGFLLLCVGVAYFQGEMDLIKTPWVLPGMLIFLLATFIPFGLRQETINNRMIELQRNSKKAEAKQEKVHWLIRNLFRTKSGNKRYRVTYTFQDHHGKEHKVTGIYRIHRKDMIPETTTIIYNPYQISTNLALIGEPNEFDWLK